MAPSLPRCSIRQKYFPVGRVRRRWATCAGEPRQLRDALVYKPCVGNSQHDMRPWTFVFYLWVGYHSSLALDNIIIAVYSSNQRGTCYIFNIEMSAHLWHCPTVACFREPTLKSRSHANVYDRILKTCLTAPTDMSHEPRYSPTTIGGSSDIIAPG
ncbi:hypothetical protein EDD18DRAFT_347154 [Armillaria luteobubalina]|uniref:Uncharacterized protein n=1 Tax=Armillaria luteobubalina TaxID=153913 RepID=A0AA39Q3G2_9AGAR|nr:hypothetical protein EDD18DRAFT_347154 [Armillaria luteobubalina]